VQALLFQSRNYLVRKKKRGKRPACFDWSYNSYEPSVWNSFEKVSQNSSMK